MNIVALLLLLLLRRTAATVLEHVLPVLFALSFLCPTVAHLDHICALLLLGLHGLLRVPDERVFAILVLVAVARAVAAPTVAIDKTSSRVDADEKRLLGVMQTSSRRGKPPRREEDEEEEKEGAPKAERERKTRAKNDSKHQLYARQKREREREKKPFERAGGNAERGGRVTVDLRDVFPAQILRLGKNITREERSSFREK